MGNCRKYICFLLLAVLFLAQRPGLASHDQITGKPLYFAGQLLVASPEIRDPRFKKSVIFLAKHTAEGAHGIVINQIFRRRPFASVMKKFGLESRGATGNLNLHYGGPVNPRGAFILHSSEFKDAKPRSVHGNISFSTDITILRAIANGVGPRHMLLALGYAGWGAGQLEDEIERGDWSLSTATEDLVFGSGNGNVWDRIIDGSRVPL